MTNELAELLKTHVIKVEFTKVNGDRRIMNCTKLTNFIPLDKLPKNIVEENDADSTIRVFDIDVKDWRSFRKDSVTSYEAIL